MFFLVPGCKHVYFCCKVEHFNVGLCEDCLTFGASASSGHLRNCSFWHFHVGFISFGCCCLVCSLFISKPVFCSLCRVHIINAGPGCCFSLSNVLVFQLWLWISLVCRSPLPRYPLTSTRPGWKNYEPQRRPDVEGSARQSAAELFINCRRVEVFTAAHVSVTHNGGVADPLPSLLPPSFAPVKPPCPMRDFHEVKGMSGVLQMTGEPLSHVPMMRQKAWISQVPSLAQILCRRESSAKLRTQWARRESCCGCGACMPCCCSMATNLEWVYF